MASAPTVQPGRRTAQAAVEFALCASVFLLLILGIFDLARAYVAYTVVSNAAREAGRYGAAHLTDVGWQTAAVQAGTNVAIGIEPGNLSLSSSETGLDGLPYSSGPPYIRVTGTYTFHSLTPFVGALLGGPITIVVDTSTLAG